MPDRVKYAAVGTGGMGRRHLRGMARLYQSSMCNMELVACCDLNADNANYYADEANELLFSLVLAGRDSRTLPNIAVAVQTTDRGIEWGVLNATGSLVLLPVIVMALLVQRHMIKGMTMGAVKG